MTPEQTTNALGALSALSVAACVGCGWGVRLGWTWERRMREWAGATIKHAESAAGGSDGSESDAGGDGEEPRPGGGTPTRSGFLRRVS